MSIPFAVQLHLQYFLKTTERLALDLSAHPFCCFVAEQLIPSDKTHRRRSDDFEVTDIFTLLLIELPHFLESKERFFTL